MKHTAQSIGPRGRLDDMGWPRLAGRKLERHAVVRSIHSSTRLIGTERLGTIVCGPGSDASGSIGGACAAGGFARKLSEAGRIKR